MGFCPSAFEEAAATDAPGLKKILSVIYDRFASWENALLGVWPNLVIPNEIACAKAEPARGYRPPK